MMTATMKPTINKKRHVFKVVLCKFISILLLEEYVNGLENPFRIYDFDY